MSGPDPKRKNLDSLAREARQDYEERKNLPVERQRESDASKSPQVSAGDLDAAWEDVDGSGEETVGGSTPTPDQDVVDELGQVVGLTYNDDEPLNGEEKLRRRDRHRWELNPASADGDADRLPAEDER
jgi:hypothetical protein